MFFCRASSLHFTTRNSLFFSAATSRKSPILHPAHPPRLLETMSSIHPAEESHPQSRQRSIFTLFSQSIPQEESNPLSSQAVSFSQSIPQEKFKSSIQAKKYLKAIFTNHPTGRVQSSIQPRQHLEVVFTIHPQPFLSSQEVSRTSPIVS